MSGIPEEDVGIKDEEIVLNSMESCCRSMVGGMELNVESLFLRVRDVKLRG